MSSRGKKGSFFNRKIASYNRQEKNLRVHIQGFYIFNPVSRLFHAPTRRYACDRCTQTHTYIHKVYSLLCTSITFHWAFLSIPQLLQFSLFWKRKYARERERVRDMFGKVGNVTGIRLVLLEFSRHSILFVIKGKVNAVHIIGNIFPHKGFTLFLSLLFYVYIQPFRIFILSFILLPYICLHKYLSHLIIHIINACLPAESHIRRPCVSWTSVAGSKFLANKNLPAYLTHNITVPLFGKPFVCFWDLKNGDAGTPST